MNHIAVILDASLVALCDKGVIDWLPDDGAPDTYVAECDIECSGHVVIVTLCGWHIFLWDTPPDGWTVYHAMSTTILPCAECKATFAASELHTIDGRLVCDYCQWRHERAADLAHDYFEKTALFDESICTGHYKLMAVPATPEERRLCHAHASEVFCALVQEHSVTEHELRAAIRQATAVQS